MTVSDTLNSRSFTAADPLQEGALASIEKNLADERSHKHKIEQILRSWDGVMVAVKIVNSQVIQKKVSTTTYDKPPLKSSQTDEVTTRNVNNAGEAGGRSKVGGSIDGDRSSGTEHTQNINRFNGEPLANQRRHYRIGRHDPQDQRVGCCATQLLRPYLQSTEP